MCLLVVKPGNAVIKDVSTLCLDASTKNPDGFGYAYIDDDGNVVWDKGMYDVSTQVQRISKIGIRPAIFHWRYGTGGGVNKENCHPFVVEDGSVLFHNGVFPITPTFDKSDTHQLSQAFISIEDICEEVSKHIGHGNKIAWLKPGNKHPMIFGIEYGKWEDDVWYSNTYWKGASKKVSDYEGYGYVSAGRTWASRPTHSGSVKHTQWNSQTGQQVHTNTASNTPSSGTPTASPSANSSGKVESTWPPVVTHQKADPVVPPRDTSMETPKMTRKQRKRAIRLGLIPAPEKTKPAVEEPDVSDHMLRKLDEIVYALVQRFGYKNVCSALDDAQMVIEWEQEQEEFFESRQRHSNKSKPHVHMSDDEKKSKQSQAAKQSQPVKADPKPPTEAVPPLASSPNVLVATPVKPTNEPVLVPSLPPVVDGNGPDSDTKILIFKDVADAVAGDVASVKTNEPVDSNPQQDFVPYVTSRHPVCCDGNDGRKLSVHEQQAIDVRDFYCLD